MIAAVGVMAHTITIGRNFAAQPRSANQTSPGHGFIDQIHDLLFH